MKKYGRFIMNNKNNIYYNNKKQNIYNYNYNGNYFYNENKNYKEKENEKIFMNYNNLPTFLLIKNIYLYF